MKPFTDWMPHGMTPLDLSAAELRECIRAFHKLEMRVGDQIEVREMPGFISCIAYPFWPAPFDFGVVGNIRYVTSCPCQEISDAPPHEPETSRLASRVD